jgi:hypothetical protein
MAAPLRYDDLSCVDCAGCKSELVGERTARQVRREYDEWPDDFPPPVHVRVNQRPYCLHCARVLAKNGRIKGKS